MKLYILFGQRRQNYDGEYAPEVLLCWTEPDVDENPEGWESAVEAAKVEATDFSATRVILVAVNGERVAGLLNNPPVVTGHVLEPDDPVR